MKNEPALTESGSPGSITIPLPRRRPSTAARTSASGARPPTGTSSARASSRVAQRAGQRRTPRSRNATASTVQRSRYLKTLRAVVEAALGGGHRLDARRSRGRRRAPTRRSPRRPARRRRRSGSASRRSSRGCRTGTRSPAGPRATQCATTSSHGSPAWTTSCVAVALDPARAHQQRPCPGTPSSAITTFDPPASTSAGAGAHRGDQFVLGVRLDQPLRGAAQAKRRERREPHAPPHLSKRARRCGTRRPARGGHRRREAGPRPAGRARPRPHRHRQHRRRPRDLRRVRQPGPGSRHVLARRRDRRARLGPRRTTRSRRWTSCARSARTSGSTSATATSRSACTARAARRRRAADARRSTTCGARSACPRGCSSRATTRCARTITAGRPLARVPGVHDPRPRAGADRGRRVPRRAAEPAPEAVAALRDARHDHHRPVEPGALDRPDPERAAATSCTPPRRPSSPSRRSSAAQVLKGPTADCLRWAGPDARLRRDRRPLRGPDRRARRRPARRARPDAGDRRRAQRPRVARRRVAREVLEFAAALA